MTAVGAAGRPTARSASGARACPSARSTLGILVLLYLPIAILVRLLVQRRDLPLLPARGLTLDWYASVLDNDAMLDAARNSFVVGVASATVATALGSLVAVAVLRFRFRGRGLLLALAGLPLIVPFVVLGVAFFLLFVALDVPRSLLTVAHRPHA